MIHSLEPVSIQTKQHERKTHVSVKNGNAPYYEIWRLRLASVLEKRGSSADAAREYAIAHNVVGDEARIQVAIAKIKSGTVMAGGEWVCFLTDWMAKNAKS